MERQVKERLIGAAVLIAAAVILIPELLSGPKRPAAVTPAVRAGEAPMKTYTIDLNHSLDAPAAVAEAAPPPDSVDATSAEQGAGADMAATQGPEAASASAEDIRSEGPAGNRPAAAQVVESPLAQAASRRDSEVSSPKPAQTNPDSVSGKASAVSARPEVSAAAAMKKPAPMPVQAPVAPPPKTLASAPVVPNSVSGTKQWAVQLGSFASKTNADRLVKEWQGRGERGLVAPLKSASGTLYRVRLGPFADRAKADEALRKVKPSIAGAAVVAHQ